MMEIRKMIGENSAVYIPYRDDSLIFEKTKHGFNIYLMDKLCFLSFQMASELADFINGSESE